MTLAASGLIATSGGFYLGLAAVFIGLVAMIWIGFGSVRGQVDQARVRRRISVYSMTGRRAREERQETTALGGSAVARSAVEFAGRVIARRDLETVLAQKLDAAGMPLKPAEWMLAHLGIAIGLPLVLLVVTGGATAPILVGLIIGLAGPFAFLTFKQSRRVSKFLAQLPDTLQLIAGSLSAGYSLPQAADTVVRQGNDPIAGEFRKALIEARLGSPLEDALDAVAARMGSKDFSWTVMAVRIQREVGGNLAEVLTTVSTTLRERQRLRRQVQVLSAEGRLSAWILGSLPVVFGLYLLLVRPGYIRPLYTDPLGIVLLVAAGIAFSIAVLVMRKIINFEV